MFSFKQNLMMFQIYKQMSHCSRLDTQLCLEGWMHARYCHNFIEGRSFTSFTTITTSNLLTGKLSTCPYSSSPFKFSTSIAAKFSTRSSSSSTDLEAVASFLVEANNILVMTGAGISTASGIPDFRSEGSGLYHNLQKYNLPYPEAVFDIDYFMMDPSAFVSLAQDLYPGVNYRPNATHFFIRLLQDKGKLFKLYTQNIDGLERLSGIKPEKLLEAHGSFSTASCTICNRAHDPHVVKENILNGSGVQRCGVNGCKGLVKPDIVFFGENLPLDFWKFQEEVHVIDSLLVMGTSLEVHPFASIAEEVRTVTPRVLINRDPVGSFGSRNSDQMILGDLVTSVTSLAERCGWGRELGELMETYKCSRDS